MLQRHSADPVQSRTLFWYLPAEALVLVVPSLGADYHAVVLLKTGQLRRKPWLVGLYGGRYTHL